MLRYALLGLLGESPDYGYRLKRRFDERIGHVWALNIGQVYQTLQKLERDGLIAALESQADAQRPPRHLYRLTSKGQRILDQWLKRPARRAHPMRDEMLIRLLVLDESGRRADVLARLQEQIRVYQRTLAQLLGKKRRLPEHGDRSLLVSEVSLENAILHTQAHLSWLNYCKELLESDDRGTDDQGGED